MYAKFEVRRLELPAARKILGTAIGMCPKEALFKGYIDLEVEVDIFCIFFSFCTLKFTINVSYANSIMHENCTRSTLR